MLYVSTLLILLRAGKIVDPYKQPLAMRLTVSSRRSQAYEPLLLENEREAVADLLQYLESACDVMAALPLHS
jgi:hypothetical protein